MKCTQHFYVNVFQKCTQRHITEKLMENFALNQTQTLDRYAFAGAVIAGSLLG